ncbi:glycosyltransferase [Gluconacetobacter sp. Hr-1-5]|uniref:glycosyltransferase n=1 Tax=Gluconacetobacter sp. Hr-1-5 TaxID=3395370 RepID=UPI003B51BF70
MAVSTEAQETRVGSSPACIFKQALKLFGMASMIQEKNVSNPNISIVINIHREKNFLARTLINLEGCIRYSQVCGLTCEIIAVFDSSDEETETVFQNTDLQDVCPVTVLRVSHRSLGLSRNSGIEAAKGTCILLHDADDLISFNALTALYTDVMQSGKLAIRICQYLFSFGMQSHILEYPDTDATSPLPFIGMHPYLSCIMFQRSLYEKIQFVDHSLSSGYAYEDWHFNATALAIDCNIRPTPDTVFFYRRRASSLSVQASTDSPGQIAPCILFEPPTFLRLSKDKYLSWKTHGRDILKTFNFKRIDALRDPVFWGLLSAANKIEPLIDPYFLTDNDFRSSLDLINPAIGVAYYEVCEIIRDKTFTDVILLPFLSVGGAERYIFDIIKALEALAPDNQTLIILGEKSSAMSASARLPKHVTILDIPTLASDLNEHERNLIVLKLIQNCAPQARIHIKPSPFAYIFTHKFLKILKNNKKIFYRFSDEKSGSDSFPIYRNFFTTAATILDEVDLILSDNKNIINNDIYYIYAKNKKRKLLYACQPNFTSIDSIKSNITQPSTRILWASRIDNEKRPELLIPISKMLYELYPEAQIDVFGINVLGHFDTHVFSSFPNITYRGPFSNFTKIATEGYACFLYTSSFDGLPNVLLEAMSVGLPIVAPAVGGIDEIIENNVTGKLIHSDTLTDEELVRAYAHALNDLLRHPEQRQQLALNALRKLEEQHGPEQYTENVKKIFEELACD